MAVYTPNKQMWVRTDPHEVTLMDMLRIAVLSPAPRFVQVALAVVGGLGFAALILNSIPA
ncbi:hypothetical protein [Methylopila sp. 73B]|uniref:hypothetical protein n=1 Tax=Methylopila sp. 73B TaxID=1120792 RepID=UPI00036D15F2|nr:hypothetical protein [Methylopila sp. 73B]